MSAAKRAEDAHRAIGRYVVTFSQLVFFMRSLLARRLTEPGQPTVLAELALGQQSATQLADAFFAVCIQNGLLDDDEKKIGRSLRSQVIKEANETRNDLAHGDWWIKPAAEGMPELPSTLARIKPAKEKEMHVFTDISVADIDQWTERVFLLSHCVAGFGSIALGYDTSIRVRDVFEMKEKRAVLRGS